MQAFNVFENDELANVFAELSREVQKDFPVETAKLVNNVAAAVQSLWASTAEEEGGGWGRRYAQTLRFEPMKSSGDSGTARVYADESDPNFMFVNFVEEGVQSWSIKDALLKGKSARTSAKTGMVYVVVPFRFRTPGSQQASSKFAGVMPQGVYERVLAGEPITADFAEKAGGTKHMAGLKRYTEGQHSSFMTFRVVTERSEGWQYPQKPARPVYEKVLAQVGPAIEASLRSFIEKYLGDLKTKFK